MQTRAKNILKTFIEEGKTKFSDEIFKEIVQLEKKIEEANEENRKLLETFFIYDPIPATGKKYTIKAVEKGYSANVQVNCEGGISCFFTLHHQNPSSGKVM